MDFTNDDRNYLLSLGYSDDQVDYIFLNASYIVIECDDKIITHDKAITFLGDRKEYLNGISKSAYLGIACRLTLNNLKMFFMTIDKYKSLRADLIPII